MVAAGLDNLLTTEILLEMLGQKKEAWVSILRKTSPDGLCGAACSLRMGKLCSFLKVVRLETPNRPIGACLSRTAWRRPSGVQGGVGSTP